MQPNLLYLRKSYFQKLQLLLNLLASWSKHLINKWLSSNWTQADSLLYLFKKVRYFQKKLSHCKYQIILKEMKMGNPTLIRFWEILPAWQGFSHVHCACLRIYATVHTTQRSILQVSLILQPNSSQFNHWMKIESELEETFRGWFAEYVFFAGVISVHI